MAWILAFSSAVVHTKHLYSPREGFLTHQCNVSEKINIKQIQRWNNDEDSTARNNWNAELKEHQQLDTDWPDQSLGIRHQLTYLKSLGRSRLWVWCPTRRRATKEGSKVINCDWVNNHACSLSYYIYVVPNLYISKNDFTKFR